jgi:diguanylate cyclase (GGDEF)-like protein
MDVPLADSATGGCEVLTGLRQSLRRSALVAVVMVMVISAGMVALIGATRATSSQESVHRGDRLALAESLATLAAGYFRQLGASEEQVAELLPQRVGTKPAAAQPPALADLLSSLPGSPTGVEVALDGQPVLVGPGATSLEGALPGLFGAVGSRLDGAGTTISQVVALDGHPDLAIAVPAGASVLVVAYRLDLLPIAAYVAQLRIASGAVPYLIDDAGRLVTSPRTADVGGLAPSADRVEAGKFASPAVVQPRTSPPQVLAVVPVGINHWHLVITQPAPKFYGALWHADTVFRWLLLGLLVVVAAALLWLHARRQAALHAIAATAVRDSLTGLPNRVAFTRTLTKAIDRHRRDGTDVALLFCDLDGFKTVNDELGHDAGDLLLQASANRIESAALSTAGATVTVARLGGDEFTVLVEGKQVRERAMSAAQAITDAVSGPFVLRSDEVIVGISVGVAYAHPDRDLLRDADLAMYRMKAVRKAARQAGAPDRFADTYGPNLQAM